MKEKEQKENIEGKIIRILSKDIEGNMTVYSGLTKIKGISWAVSNFICKSLGLDKRKKIGALSKEEINNITNFVNDPLFKKYLKNRPKDFETGEEKHLIGADLELKTNFDVKRLKKIKSYRGFRHMSKLPLRGQRTKSNFRRNKSKGVGIKKKKRN